MKPIDRRTLLVGGGAGIGLIVAFSLWPRELGSALSAGKDEHVFGHYLKVATDGQVTVAVPQAETGQGIWTGLAQLVADELGADWENVAVVPAPDSPVYRNAMLDGRLTAGATSIRAFEGPLRKAGAMARDLLVRAAAKRWGVAAAECTVRNGFVTHEDKRAAFGEIAADAAGLSARDDIEVRAWGAGGLVGQPLPRLDLPAKSDGSLRFAGDVRLPNMVLAAVRIAPPGGELKAFSRSAAERPPGVQQVMAAKGWLAAIGETWRAAERALQAAQPHFSGHDRGARTEDATDFKTIFDQGDFDKAVGSARALGAAYRIAPSQHLGLEPMAVTARLANGRLEVWTPVQDYDAAHRAAADAAGLKQSAVTLYPMPVGDSGGAAMRADLIPIAVELAKRTGKPVQLTLSANGSQNHDRPRSPLLARMAGLPAPNGAVQAWSARLAVAGDTKIENAVPPYAIPSIRVERANTESPFETGYMRGGLEALAAFATESFVDEMARALNADPFVFRMGMLGGSVRLAKCLTAATAIGGWDGGGKGSTMGVAGSSAFGSHIALLVQAGLGADQRIQVEKMVAAVDCGRMVNPNLVRQQIEGSLLHALDLATTPAPEFVGGMPVARPLGGLGLRRLSPVPKIEIELIGSRETSGGVSGLGHLVCAAAVANALASGTGRRLRNLPFNLMAA